MSRLIANVEGAMNAIVVKTDAADGQLFYGKGAGSEPTGSAVIADLVDIARTIDAKSSQRPLMPTLSTLGDRPWAPFEEIRSSYYLRIPVEDKPGVLADIAKIIADNNISIESLIQKEPVYPETRTEVILMTHLAQEKAVQNAIAHMQQLPSVLGSIVVLRKEELR
jgi:homoserine dehydrogenase